MLIHNNPSNVESSTDVVIGMVHSVASRRHRNFPAFSPREGTFGAYHSSCGRRVYLHEDG